MAQFKRVKIEKMPTALLINYCYFNSTQKMVVTKSRILDLRAALAQDFQIYKLFLSKLFPTTKPTL